MVFVSTRTPQFNYFRAFMIRTGTMLPILEVLLLLNFFSATSESYGIVDSSQILRTRIDIPKCCPENQVIIMNETSTECEEYVGSTLQFSNLTVYKNDSYVHDEPVNVSFTDLFRVTPEIRPTDEEIPAYLYLNLDLIPYLAIDGILFLEHPHAYKRWITLNSSSYCVDYIKMDGNLTNTFNFLYVIPFDPPKQMSIYYKAALVVSSAFLFLVLVVYMLLPGLRNLTGMILISYVFSLLLAFILLSVLQLQDHTMDACRNITTTTYFFFLASFCWMNVMSFDIWWTFRGYAKARPIHRRGETFKFRMYCIYGFGVPLAMTIFFDVINRTELPGMTWFIKPLVPELGCFIEGGQKLVYLYAPMLILILCNWIFFIMTAFNIWRLNRGTAVLDSPAAGTPAAHRNQRTRFFIYVKLSILMGINWILEVVSSLTPDFQFWFISDLYNMFIGVAIFLIFVCKKKIYTQLKARCCQYQKPQRSLAKSHTSSTMLSNSSQDTPLQVYHHPNPNGAGKRRLSPA